MDFILCFFKFEWRNTWTVFLHISPTPSFCLPVGKADGILVRLQLGTELCLRPLPRWKCHSYNSSHSCIARKPGASTWWKANSFNRIAETWFQILKSRSFVDIFCLFVLRFQNETWGFMPGFCDPWFFSPKDPRFCVENLVRKLKSFELAEADPSEEAAWEAAAVRGSKLAYCTLVDCFCMLLHFANFQSTSKLVEISSVTQRHCISQSRATEKNWFMRTSSQVFARAML